ncbi:hypothetical protein FRC02_009372 [Tulasnella sp. 418]|nr:hypothetical protein FRC02_009372 [Tulasnella sp. 418]
MGKEAAAAAAAASSSSTTATKSSVPRKKSNAKGGQKSSDPMQVDSPSANGSPDGGGTAISPQAISSPEISTNGTISGSPTIPPPSASTSSSYELGSPWTQSAPVESSPRITSASLSIDSFITSAPLPPVFASPSSTSLLPMTNDILSISSPGALLSAELGSPSPPVWSALASVDVGVVPGNYSMLGGLDLDPLITDPFAPPSQFGKWYSFPPNTSPTSQYGSESSSTVAEDAFHRYLNGDQDIANTLGLDVLSPERTWHRAVDLSTTARTACGIQRLDTTDPYYLPSGVFSGCYTVPHWMLPPVHKLSYIARHTVSVLTSQMSIIHEPTFRLDKTHAFTAFSLCTTGTRDPYDRVFGEAAMTGSCPKDPWKLVSSLVRQEKADMLVKNFVRRHKQLSFQECFSVVQALLIYHAPSFLAEDRPNRITGQLFLSTIVKIARQTGLYQSDAEWLRPRSEVGDLETQWKTWIRMESIRRTLWIIYLLDTVAALESGIPPLVSPRDMRHFPLPAAPPVWNARTPQEWYPLLKKHFTGVTLDTMVSKSFYLESLEPPAEFVCLGTRVHIGPFARLAVVLTLLKGLLDFGEGARKGGPVTQMWAVHPEALDADPVKGLESCILNSYQRAFTRWRQGWDFDQLCHGPSRAPPSMTNEASNLFKDSALMHDATPYFWFAMVIMDVLRGKVLVDPRREVFGDMQEEIDLNAKDGDWNYLRGLDYAGMLNIAKQFAHSGEGI